MLPHFTVQPCYFLTAKTAFKCHHTSQWLTNHSVVHVAHCGTHSATALQLIHIWPQRGEGQKTFMWNVLDLKELQMLLCMTNRLFFSISLTAFPLMSTSLQGSKRAQHSFPHLADLKKSSLAVLMNNNFRLIYLTSWKGTLAVLILSKKTDEKYLLTTQPCSTTCVYL